MQSINSKGDTIYSDATKTYKPEELIGRYRDITHCDQCGVEFKRSDENYINYFALKPEELTLLKEVMSETSQ